jgi:hypothetical protein
MSKKSSAPAASNAPVQTFRLGRIQAAVWANKTDAGKTFYNVTFSRGYTDEKGEWHDSDSFGRDDLPLVAKVADQAHSFIFAELAKKNEDQAAE